MHRAGEHALEADRGALRQQVQRILCVYTVSDVWRHRHLLLDSGKRHYSLMSDILLGCYFTLSWRVHRSKQTDRVPVTMTKAVIMGHPHA